MIKREPSPFFTHFLRIFGLFALNLGITKIVDVLQFPDALKRDALKQSFTHAILDATKGKDKRNSSRSLGIEN